MLQLNPLSPEGYIGRGNAYMEYGHNKGFRYAQRDFVMALHLNPMCIAAWICLGYNLQVSNIYMDVISVQPHVTLFAFQALLPLSLTNSI